MHATSGTLPPGPFRLVFWRWAGEDWWQSPNLRSCAQGFMGGVVPLSEHEQRQLEQIEQALYSEDPKFGRLVRSSDPRVHYKRKLVQALVGVIVGAGLLAAGVVTHRLYLDAAGAAVLLLSLVWAVVSWRRHAARVRPAKPPRAK